MTLHRCWAPLRFSTALFLCTQHASKCSLTGGPWIDRPLGPWGPGGPGGPGRPASPTGPWGPCEKNKIISVFQDLFKLDLTHPIYCSNVLLLISLCKWPLLQGKTQDLCLLICNPVLPAWPFMIQAITSSRNFIDSGSERRILMRVVDWFAKQCSQNVTLVLYPVRIRLFPKG